MNRSFQSALIVACLSLGTTLAHASGVTYTCSNSVDAEAMGLCATLNSVVGGGYASLLSNANAKIYIDTKTTGLGDSTTGFFNFVSYSTYLAALTSGSSGDAVDIAALASLAALTGPNAPSSDISITSALAEALNITDADHTGGNTTGIDGTTSSGAECLIGTPGCYNGIIRVIDNTDSLSQNFGQGIYYGTDTSAVPSNDYDYFSIVQHETNELLGTSSCFGVDAGPAITNGCGGDDSETDLFRYQAPNTKVYSSTTPGAYFSYNGGATAVGPVYNTVNAGEDYADFYPSSDAERCDNVQSAEGGLGCAPLDQTDGGAEATILDTIGYNRAATVVPSPTPEPGSLALLGTGIAALSEVVRRRRKM